VRHLQTRRLRAARQGGGGRGEGGVGRRERRWGGGREENRTELPRRGTKGRGGAVRPLREKAHARQLLRRNDLPEQQQGGTCWPPTERRGRSRRHR
jgi:hypothetical protein